MKKIEVYSKKTGKKVIVKTVKANSGSLGWILHGWSNGWKAPIDK